MPLKIDEKDLQSLLALYNYTQAEITRYRDKEWKNAGLFTASITVIVGFIVANKDIARNFWVVFDLGLLFLAGAHIYYSIFAHNQLTKQRNVRKRIEYLLGLGDIRVEGKDLVPFDIGPPIDNKFWRGWTQGFYSHLLPFFLAGILLAMFGMLLMFH